MFWDFTDNIKTLPPPLAVMAHVQLWPLGAQPNSDKMEDI